MHPMLTTADDRDPSATWEVATHGRRLAGYLVDLVVLNVLMSAALTVAHGLHLLPAAPVSVLPDNPAYQHYMQQVMLLALPVMILYYVGFEALSFRTPGKMVCQTRVMRPDGDDPTVLRVLARTLLRLLPLEQLSFLGPLNSGWHDRWTDTCVVRRVDLLAAEEEDGEY